MLQSVLAVVGVTVTPLVIVVVAWLIFCAWTQHRLPAGDAAKVIEATGKWFPLRLRAPIVEAPGLVALEDRRDRAA